MIRKDEKTKSSFDPVPNYSGIARSAKLHALKVDVVKDVAGAIKKASKNVQSGTNAVLNDKVLRDC
ncbi:hypothetical protein N0V82_000895 [Gnomoniopsis sp. IMI 355080]|nr:hypothetical protein N0V82_000895 [Gnomoniopsis sp. IMI 355080]